MRGYPPQLLPAVRRVTPPEAFRRADHGLACFPAAGYTSGGEHKTFSFQDRSRMKGCSMGRPVGLVQPQGKPHQNVLLSSKRSTCGPV